MSSTGITIRELARLCGVAVSTVSRAMNDRDDVSPETKKKVHEAARRYGYVPNSSARALKISDSNSVLVVIQGETGRLLISVLQLLEAAFAESGFDTNLTHVADHDAEAATIERMVRAGRYQCVVFLGRYGTRDREESVTLSRRLAQIDVPLVFCTTSDYSISGSLHSFVSVDDRQGEADLTSYLIERGHRRIAFIGAGSEIDAGHAWAQRLAGYEQSLVAAGIGVDPELIIEAAVPERLYTMENGFDSIGRRLARGPLDFTAAVGVCDEVSIGVASALRQAGLNVPDDVSLVGFDGLDLSRYWSPRLTTLAQPLDQIAETTARVTLNAVRRPEAPAEQVWIRGEISEGDSVRLLG
ncbi:LacI family transcriptional regulator [Tessaracoccus sp. HDW20]|uniref:LacI family DNA-binding transcriptional regulator n=1 Tax=Tessaracoccus coleopterorum TaxID=2714950 RepID=UPI0018D4BB72|nr:LacI family DNA-binding transcriptional regulator [Tessaracoccus coleopterorum]NHB85361.1 LacI family transcriptional regulator [Tessaracoccus coleopterorum]